MHDANIATDPKKKSFYERWSIWILLCTLIAAPAAFYGAAKAVASNVNKVEDWLPKSFAETKELGWFRKNFPTDQFILISWEGCKIGNGADIPDDPRISQLTRLLRGEAVPELDANPPANAQAIPDVNKEVLPKDVTRFIKAVNNGPEMLANMTGTQMNIPRETAVERLRGSLLGPDGAQTCLVVSVTTEATSHLREVMGRGQKRLLKMRKDVPPGIIHRAIARVGIEPDKVHFGGPPVDNIAIDEEGEKTLVRLAGLSGILGLGLAYWSLRSIKLTMVVCASGVLSAAAALAFIWITGETVDAVVLSMPALVYVLSISGAVHYVNYYRDAVLEGGMYRATERAVIHAFKPAFLCSITTSFGLLSLYASDLTPIRKFGLYSAAGVMMVLLITFFYLPAALQYWNFGRRWLNQPGTAEEAPPEELRNTRSERFWAAFSGFIVRHYVGVGVLTTCFTLAVGWGVTKTKTSIDLLELFDSRARILQDYRWLETNIGRLVPMEIVIKFDKKSQSTGPRDAQSESEELYRLLFLERLETVALIQDTIEAKFGEKTENIVGRSISAATFAPSLPSGSGGFSDFVKRKVYDQGLSKSRDEFIKSGFLRIDPNDGSELWRISLRVAAFEGVDYGQFVHELSDEIAPITAAHDYRLQILRKLTQTNDKYAGAEVFIWDRPYADPKLQQRHRLMTSALNSLLRKARITVKGGVLDPSVIPQVTLDKLFQPYDAVVLAGVFSDNEVQLIGHTVKNVVDLKVNVAQSSAIPTLVPGSDSWLSAVYTGVVPIVYKAQRELLQSLIESTIWSFLTITPLMMLVSRSIRAGMVAMLPNVMPILLVFGAMGWMGISVDIGSMMTASIALGVAVDDTIHFLSWFKGELNRLKDRKLAIIASYRRCATPTLQAALISGLGLSVFAFSTFTPTQRFGWLMLTILVAGVASELILLPSILASPLGKVFEPHSHKRGIRRWWLLAQYHLRRRSGGSLSHDSSQKAA